MNLSQQLRLWILALLLEGCTPPVVEAPALDTKASSVIEVAFVEGAPKDRFVITNMGACAREDLTVSLDLSQSAGMLIFDTTATGAGVEVYQPFDTQQGDVTLIGDRVNDGDTQLSVRVPNLGPGDSASFTIDVDDTLTNGELGQIRIAGSEISGAMVILTTATATTSAQFDGGSTAQAHLPACSALR